MKKVLLTLIILSLGTSAPAQLVLHLEITPSLHFPNAFFQHLPETFSNPQQVYYKSGQFLRFKVFKKLYLGAGLQQERLISRGDHLLFVPFDSTRPMLQLTELSDSYLIDPNGRDGSFNGVRNRVNFPVEIGYSFIRKKKYWGLDANFRITLLHWEQRIFQAKGPKLTYQGKYAFTDFLFSNQVNIGWQLSAGTTYRINRYTQLDLNGTIGTERYQPYQDYFFGINLGLDYTFHY